VEAVAEQLVADAIPLTDRRRRKTPATSCAVRRASPEDGAGPASPRRWDRRARAPAARAGGPARRALLASSYTDGSCPRPAR
jgi:hypothetical protein